MHVNTVYRFLALVLATLAAFPALAQSWTFDLPTGWTVEWKPDEKNKLLPMDAVFASSTDRLNGKLVVRRGAKIAAMGAADLNGVVSAMAEDLLPLSREGQLTLRSFGAGNAGQYARLTLKDSAEPFMFATFAVFRKGEDLMIGVLSSNDSEASQLPKFLKLFDSIVVGQTPAARPVAAQNSALKGKKPIDPDVAWGAIATDVAIGGTDPYYGIGGGDTQAEAEKNALRFCREAGAKRCALRLAYTQCGAYASSNASFGTGMAATKREAERLALGACKEHGCEMVVADCN